MVSHTRAHCSLEATPFTCMWRVWLVLNYWSNTPCTQQERAANVDSWRHSQCLITVD